LVRIASYNVENLFARPKVFNPTDWSLGKPALDAYGEVNTLIGKTTYSPADKNKIRDLLVTLDIYTVNTHGAIRRKSTPTPRWAWLCKNRGTFDREPQDVTQDVEIIANGRSDWIGWVELATEPTDEVGTRLTARVIQDVGADIIGIVEAEDRPSLVRFNNELLNDLYGHAMLVDGNDERGIDVAIMTRANVSIESIRSNVDATDAVGLVFSRDCPQYEVRTPNGTTIHILVNHFKSQSGGGGTAPAAGDKGPANRRRAGPAGPARRRLGGPQRRSDHARQPGAQPREPVQQQQPAGRLLLAAGVRHRQPSRHV
jgi:Endonuclease/Exonuclease/phosphatase family